MAEIGDGLCVGINTNSDQLLQIDWGGSGSLNACLTLYRILNHYSTNSPDAFLLTHFHSDHYNGLLFASRHATNGYSFNIKQVFFPRIPDFPEKRRFLIALFAICARTFGNETGSADYDFLRAISKLNAGNHYQYQALSKGDHININGSYFEVLWPPRIIDKSDALSVVLEAMVDFNRALEEDGVLREIYEALSEEKGLEKYLETHEPESKNPERSKDFWDPLNISEERIRRSLPNSVKKANASLRKAANRFSLAIAQSDGLLFFGDQESSEINAITDDLFSRNRRRFDILVTPHHGTHWGKSLGNILCSIALASNGNRLFRKTLLAHKGIAANFLVTHINGDISVHKKNIFRIGP